MEGFEVIGEAENGEELLDKIRKSPCDVVLLDVDMPVMDGLEACLALRSAHPDIKVLILSMHDDRHLIQKVMEAGAHGYILKNSGIEELSTGLEAILSGKKYFSSDLTLRLLDTQNRPAGVFSKELDILTDREIEVLKLIAAGMSNKEIGDKLFISHRTVDSHRTSLMKKLSVHNVAGLIRFAIKHRLTR